MRTACLLLVLSVLTLVPGCTDVPNDGIPSYIAFDSVRLVTDATTEGADSEEIVDVWVQVGDQLLGGYEMPLVLPVFADGDQRLRLDAGILLNDDYFQREIYPFYAQVDTQLTLVPRDTIRPEITVRYAPLAQFPLLEDFESGNAFDDMGIDTATEWGVQSGRLDPPRNGSVVSGTSAPVTIPTGGRVFVELDWWGDEAFFDLFVEGVAGGATTEDYRVGRMGTTDGWEKIYLEISNEIGVLADEGYTLRIEAFGVQDAANDPVLRLDNVKVIHF